MELIFYANAAELLGVSVDTLKQAVIRGVLTKRAPQNGRRQCLIKEQVNLFVGINPRTGKKKRLSLEALNIEEKSLWKQYANETSISDEEVIRRVTRQELSKEANQVREQIIKDLMESLGGMLTRPKTQAVAR